MVDATSYEKNKESTLTMEAWSNYASNGDCEDKWQVDVEVKFFDTNEEIEITEQNFTCVSSHEQDKRSNESQEKRETELPEGCDITGISEEGTWKILRHQRSCEVKKSIFILRKKPPKQGEWERHI